MFIGLVVFDLLRRWKTKNVIKFVHFEGKQRRGKGHAGSWTRGEPGMDMDIIGDVSGIEHVAGESPPWMNVHVFLGGYRNPGSQWENNHP